MPGEKIVKQMKLPGRPWVIEIAQPDGTFDYYDHGEKIDPPRDEEGRALGADWCDQDQLVTLGGLSYVVGIYKVKP